MHPSTRIVIITGLSGAGKTVALRALEDTGFYCIDNLPPQFLSNVIEFTSTVDSVKEFAIGIDVREKSFLDGIEQAIGSLRDSYNVETIFLEAEQSILIRRFKETRRPHPLSISSGSDIKDALELEHLYLTPLRGIADRIIDTSSYTPHQLRSVIAEEFGGGKGVSLGINLLSFGYKFGIPQNADLLFDIRFLPNPNFVPELKDLTGLDGAVREYVLREGASSVLLDKLNDLLGFLIPEYSREGKASLTIGIGCTGGKHRSPVIVEELKRHIESVLNLEVTVIHREL